MKLRHNLLNYLFLLISPLLFSAEIDQLTNREKYQDTDLAVLNKEHFFNLQAVISGT